MLRNKLFFYIVFIITIILFINATIYYKNINYIFDTEVQADIDADDKELIASFDKIKNGIKSLSNEIVTHEDLKASLNLISLYEDKNEYIKETFDYEKKELISLSKKWIKDSAHYSLEIFDNDMKLIAINRVFDANTVLGYVSYDGDENGYFYNYKDAKKSKMPFISVLDKQHIHKYTLDYYQDRFLISYLNPVYLDGNLIGYIKITTDIDTQKLKNINSSLKLPFVLKDKNGNFLYPSKEIQKSFSEIQKSNDYKLVQENLAIGDKVLEALFIIDKTIVNDQINDITIKMIWLWIAILIVVFILSAYFINKSILIHINNMKNIISDIKAGKFHNEYKSVSNNKISQIVDDFYKLSVDLHKNIAFLKSYELAMNESNIVSKADLSGKITYVNDNFCKISGYTRDEVIGKSHNIVRHKDNSKEIFKDLWKTIREKKVWKGVIKNRGKLDDYWIDVVIIPILDENNDIVEYMAVRHDITEVINQKEKLDTIANTDALTGLVNRYKLNNDIKDSKSPALAILNIDNFSQFNDFYGEEHGDEIIKEFGVKLQESTGNRKCCLYHIQGDEFAIFGKDTTKEKFIKSINEIREYIAKSTFMVENDKITINFTTGVSFEDKDKVFITADMALKIAKRYNNDFIIYDDEISLNSEYENNIKWTKKIKEAIANDKILPVFQPIVNNTNEKWEKYEALVRIDDGDRLISPFFFLEISKKTKHYTQITKIMIEKSFEEFKDRDAEFSINLTIEDILNEDIKEFIFMMLEKYKIGQRVVFEIVESESIENFDDVLNFIDIIRKYGCMIAIDDFGTGYSNFEYLLKLKTDYVKIDGSMIKNIDTDIDAQLVVATMVDFAKKMGIKTIAEFVENESILNKVKELGIDYSQGYHFSPPKREIS